MKVQEVIDKIIEMTGVPPLPLDQTCDQLMCGSADMEVLGIATTFMATVEVIQQAIEQGINMIITHEPTWYTGNDYTQWLERDADEVYLQKKALLDENHIAIWRYHDHMHMAQEDGIYRGVIQDLGWKDYVLATNKLCFELPETTVEALCMHLKKTLDVKMVRLVGRPGDKVSRVGVFVGGFSLGFESEQQPMEIIREQNLDVAVCGDILEWTICPYIRDAVAFGMSKAMIVLGHERSEESGMKHMVEWMKPEFGEMKLVFIDAKEPFDYL